MKIIVVTPDFGAGDVPLGRLYAEAFAELGHETFFLAQNSRVTDISFLGRSFSYLKRTLSPITGASQISENILVEKIKQFRADIAVFIRCDTLSLGAIREIKKCTNMSMVNIYPDSPLVIPGVERKNFSEWLAEFDVIFSSDSYIKKVFYQLGAKKVEFLPFAYDPKYHSPKALANSDSTIFSSPVAYVGTFGRLQKDWLSSIQHHGLKVWGNSWDSLSKRDSLRTSWIKGRGIGAEMWKAINLSGITFNMCRVEHSAEISMKTFEIPAAGGLMLSNYTETQNAFFKDGVQAVYYNNREEASDLIEFYIKRPELIEKIKFNSMKAVERHTYQSRAKAVIDYVLTSQMTSFI
jgi:spore maturation protein CgeB